MTDETFELLNPAHRLMTANLLAQEALIKSLRDARVTAGLTVEEVAARLGVGVEIVQQVEAHEYDMSLTELRQYAYAVDAFIEYDVEPGET